MKTETAGTQTSTTDVENDCWRLSIWERLTRKGRVKSLQLGIDPKIPLFNKLAFGKKQSLNVEEYGETKLYRMDTLEHVLSAIKNKRLWLPRPSSWEDPWEDSVWRHLEANGLSSASGMEYDCFALCWAKAPSCEAIWRRMKSKGRVVRIETTVKRLLSSIKIPEGDDIADIDEQVSVGEVYYLDETEEEQFKHEIFDSLTLNDMKGKSDNARIASLFAKRKAFEYEQEVRLVFRTKRQPNKPSRKFYELDLDPRTLIQSLQVDPWCGDCEYELIAREFERMKLDCSKSDLAKPIA